MMDSRATMTVEEASKILKVSRSTAYEAVRRGQLPSIRLGKRLVIPVAALEKMLDHTPGSPEEEHEAPR